MSNNDYWHISTQVTGYDQQEAADEMEEAMLNDETEDWECTGYDSGTCLTSRANLHRILDYILENGGHISFALSKGGEINLENYK